MSEPDLFVVCKNCSSEVSPYVTECPYCGQRVRKRAPKIERRRGEEEGERRRVRPPRLSPLKRGEIPGIAPETRPYATMLLIALSLAATLAISTNQVSEYDLGGLYFQPDGDWWRLVATPFVYTNGGYEFVARQEIIFGIHVHVGIDDPDKAIHVVNGMRVHMPLLLALSANSPFWRGDQTGLNSTRTPIFRAFPRVGIPPRYDNFEDYAKRIEFMTTCRVIGDYTYLWYDVRPHPDFGTVEIRVMDSQTRVEHTLALAALVQAMVKELCEHFEAGKRLSRYPYEMLDENKWLAARHGLDGELVDLPKTSRVPVRELSRRVIDRLRPHAEELGSLEEYDVLQDILDNGNGASRQVVVYSANHDLREVVQEILDATVPEPAEATGE